MKIITTTKKTIVSEETFNSPRISRTSTIEKVESIISEVEMASYEERESLKNFLKRKGYKQSDGILGDQADFGACSSRKNNVERIYIELQAQGEKHQKMIDAVKDWFNKKK